MKKLINGILLVVLLVGPVKSLIAQTIITVVGVGVEGFTGDGGSPLAAQLHWPTSIAMNSYGDMYIADALNNTIRLVSGGVVTTVAGTGFEAGTGFGAFSGDGAAATAAQLYFPTGIALDAAGNLYIADQNNNRIRKVDMSSGNISTIAGIGVAGYSGDGAAANTAQIDHPTRVAVDASANIYIADAGNSSIRKIDPSGNISTFAGTGVAGFAGDGGPASAAQLDHPTDMAIDAAGNVYIADLYNNRIRKVDALTGNIGTFAGNGLGGFGGDGGPGLVAAIYQPSGIAVDASGNIYVSQMGDSRIRKITASDTVYSLAGTDTAGYNGDNRPSSSAQVWSPQGLAVNGLGNLWVADQGNNRIRLISGILAVQTVGGADIGMNMYPNPGNGSFNLDIRSMVDEKAVVQVTNIAGEKVYEVAITTNQPTAFSLSQPPGIYFVSVATGNGLVNGRLVIR